MTINQNIKFTLTNPYKIVVTGRIKHFTSAFGEHVIAEEVESALRKATEEQPCEINEFHVAPFISQIEGKGHL